MSVFQIRDIFVRIRIFGSVHLIADPVPATDPSLIPSDFEDGMAPENGYFVLIFFAYYFLWAHVHQSSKITCHKEDTKQQKSRLFLILFWLLMEGSGSVQIITDPEAQKNGSGTLVGTVQLVLSREISFDYSILSLMANDKLVSGAQSWISQI